jgi:hypothetical protein
VSEPPQRELFPSDAASKDAIAINARCLLRTQDGHRVVLELAKDYVLDGRDRHAEPLERDLSAPRERPSMQLIEGDIDICLEATTMMDLSHVRGNLVVGPARVLRALLGLAQPPGQPVELLGLPQPLPWRHGTVPRQLFR